MPNPEIDIARLRGMGRTFTVLAYQAAQKSAPHTRRTYWLGVAARHPLPIRDKT